MLSSRRHIHPSILIALVALITLGCGSTHKPVASVTGTVTHDGQGVVGLSVTFYPLPKTEEEREPGKMAYGETDADGKYRLTTYKQGDGAVVGRHRVTVEYPDPFDLMPGKFVGPKELEVESRNNVFDFVLE